MSNIDLIIKVYECFFSGDLDGRSKCNTENFELKQLGRFLIPERL